ncbi:MAG: hypothetical protein JJU26_13320 [Oceanicaulis sp.]|nr:hypothetical protein [Oceanicaulis sp.]
MPQTTNSGSEGNEFGRRMAPQLAAAVGATLLGKTSNEATLGTKRVVLKSANSGTTAVGVTHKMLDRIDEVIAAFGKSGGLFVMYSLPAATFSKHMRESASKGAKGHGVGLVSRGVFEEHGREIGTFRPKS